MPSMAAPKLVPLPKSLRKLLVLFFATGAFSGYVPIAPGTAGSALAVALLWWMGQIPALALIGLSVALLVIGIWSAGEACQVLRKDDASQIVIDEIVGVFITMIGIPLTPYWLVVGFCVFRVLDIVKPPPAKYCDTKIHGGVGVMLDDVVAGIYGNILLHLMLRAQF